MKTIFFVLTALVLSQAQNVGPMPAFLDGWVVSGGTGHDGSNKTMQVTVAPETYPSRIWNTFRKV